MNLWLFSSGGTENHSIDEILVAQIGKKVPKMTFISPGVDEGEEYYDEFIDRFSQVGYCDFHLVHVDKNLTKRDIGKIEKSDLLYLSGGNTYYFLKYLRQGDLTPLLYKHMKSDRPLAGHSAGSILMTPNIHTAGYPYPDHDENEVGLRNFRALGWVNFEILPHYDDNRQNAKIVRETSREVEHPIFALADGTGISVSGPAISFFGEIWAFQRGTKTRIASWWPS
jgi:dipeptidase E